MTLKILIWHVGRLCPESSSKACIYSSPVRAGFVRSSCKQNGLAAEQKKCVVRVYTDNR